MKKIIIFIISILTSFSIYMERVLKEVVTVYGSVKNIKLSSLNSFFYSNTDALLTLFIAVFLIFFYKKYYSIEKKRQYNILSFIFSLLLTFGFSYSVIGNASLVFGNILLFLLSILKLIMYYLFLSTIINLLAEKIKNINLKEPKIIKKFKNYYELHPYKTTILILLILWLPYIISFYPSIVSSDPANQIKNYYGMDTRFSTSVNLINDNIKITNHHPVLITFILGGCTKIGEALGNINFGLFLYSCFQIFVLISAFTYSLIYLKKIKVPFIYRFIVLIMYAVIPVFPLYAMSPVKDTLFGALLIFFIIELHRLITTNYKKTDYFFLGLLMLLMMLTRNNGLYIILFTIIGCILVLKNKRLPLIITIICTIFTYNMHNKILLPIYNITSGSIREALSVPFQATARLAKYHDEDISIQDKKIIDKVLNYETLGSRYHANLADYVKDEFNKDATREDIKDFLLVWFKYLFRYPATYINATINNIYGYFYPNTSNWYVYHNYDKKLTNVGLDYHFIECLGIPRSILGNFGVIYPYIPMIGLQVNIGFNTWIYMFLLTYLIVENKKKLIILLIPAFTLLLTVVAGPVNTYFRYMVPIVFSLPLIVGLIYESLIKKN